MERPAIQKSCTTCGRAIRGRSDKRFCTDQCRNQYHNGTADEDTSLIRKINYLLRKNRKILKEYSALAAIVSREALLEAGFSFRYYTHCTREGEKTTSYGCYDYAYEWVDDNHLRILPPQCFSF